ncbi:MAG: acyl transferase, partial [Bacteroidota bacterium]
MHQHLIASFKEAILSSNYHFDSLAMEIFQFQAEYNSVYSKYLATLGVQSKNISSVQEIPFLPIEFYKSHTVQTTDFTPDKIYKSSGTGESGRSRHYMHDNSFYLQHAQRVFEAYYGSLSEYSLAAILPSYQQQGDSSLIAMTDYFIEKTNDPNAGYYLAKAEELTNMSALCRKQGRKLLIIGVTYALLEIARTPVNLEGHVIMETGGMKGRGKELVRQELHTILCNAFNVDQIHSEYGMTELTSQAYAKELGVFHLPKSMKVLIRDINDPFYYLSND